MIDGSEIRRSPVEVGEFPLHLRTHQGSYDGSWIATLPHLSVHRFEMLPLKQRFKTQWTRDSNLRTRSCIDKIIYILQSYTYLSWPVFKPNLSSLWMFLVSGAFGCPTSCEDIFYFDVSQDSKKTCQKHVFFTKYLLLICRYISILHT